MIAAATAALRRPLGAAVELALELPPRWRRRILWALASLALLASLHLFWFRDSGFVRVERVTVTGVTTSDSARLRQALTATAQTMTTLHVDRDRLEHIARGYPVVAGLEISPDFPHGLRVHVVEHQPAALVISGRSKVAVAGDGTVLRGLPTTEPLPEVKLAGALPPERLSRGEAWRAVRVAGAAPAPLRRRLASVGESGRRGLVARVRRGPELIFGDATRLEAKWAAAARVLADRGSRGASYIDLRLPERPAAGGLPVETLAPVAPAGEGQVSSQSPVAGGQTTAPTPTAPAPPVPAPQAQVTPSAPGPNPHP